MRVGFALLIVAACNRTSVGDTPAPLPSATTARASIAPKPRVMLLLDMSNSMRAKLDDESQTRFEAAKASVITLIREHAATPIGVVLFGKGAQVVSPPMTDHDAELTAVEAATIGKTVNPNGTELGRAIVAADTALGDDHASSLVLILTDAHSGRRDGANEDDVDALDAARTAASHGRHITIVQVSNQDVASVEDGVDLFGKPHVVKLSFPVDHELMDALAAATGGHVLVKPSAGDLRRLLDATAVP